MPGPKASALSVQCFALLAFDAPDPDPPALYAAGSALDSGDAFLARWQGCLDLLPPVLSCPEAVHASDHTAATPGDLVSFTVTATDEVDSAPDVVCSPPSGSFFPEGTTLVTCTATDASGNQSTCQFPLTVTPKARRR